MKRILTTPAGRKRYLELLFNHLKNQKNEFDEWILWMNTNVQEDLDYMKKLSDENEWVKLQPSKMDQFTSYNIHHFFHEAIDENAVYIRLDDDVIYIHPGSLTKLFNFRISNPEYFLVYGNILNNALTSHLHQRRGVLPDYPKLGYMCTDENGWNNPHVTETIHREFFKSYNNGEINKFFIDNWLLHYYERCSINVISWLGKTFKEFNGQVGNDEEQWLSVDKPIQIQKPNIIFGEGLFIHYAFFTQRNHIDSTDILNIYKIISEKYV